MSRDLIDMEDSKIVLQTSRIILSVALSLLSSLVLGYILSAWFWPSTEILFFSIGSLFSALNLALWAFTTKLVVGEGRNKPFWGLQLVFLKLLLILLIFKTVREWTSSSLILGLIGFLLVMFQMLLFLGFLPKKK